MTTPIVVTIPVELNAGATGTALGGLCFGVEK